MKKIYLLLTFLLGFVANAQIINFPDPVFKSVLLSATPSNQIAKNLAGNYFKIDANNDSEIDVTEALQVSQLSFINTNTTSLVGISYFTNLTKLACNQNHIVSLDVSALVNLTILDCSANTTITSLNINGLVNLQNLICQSNLLTYLDLTGLDALTYINCQANQLTSLDLSGKSNLTSLYTGYNQLSTLDVSDSINLSLFGFDANPIVSLFVKNGKSEILLDFGQVSTLQYICADDADISTVQAKLNQYGFTNCQVNSYCSFVPGGPFYSINGNNRFDGDSNGCDAFDFSFSNLKFSISNGTTTGTVIPNTSGFYNIPVQSGSYTITPLLDTPTYFTISPTTVSTTFPTQTSPYIQDFCITPNGIHNDLEITILPINLARPGFDAKYKIIYKNKGTTTQSGSVNLNFNDAVLDLVVANPVIDSQTLNNLNWNFINLQPFETREILVTLNVNSPSETPPVNSGYILNYVSTIIASTDETPLDNVSKLNQTVVNSFDPNDKTCLEGSIISSSQVGNYIHYIIRFENTGTANAENIVVKDIIDTNKFNFSTLQPIDGSHPFITRITQTNKVEFIFENINLPFDDANNDGYVAFKIKTKPTLITGNTFSNSASIYFDYNFPIITNTATTVIQALTNPDFEFSDYFELAPNPAKEFLAISTKKDIELSSISIYNTLGQLVIVIPNAKETNSIDVSQLKTGTYFIKIVSDNGSSNSKFIKQ